MALLVALAGCGTPGGRAADPAGGGAPRPPSASGIPPARGEVASRMLATVMDTGRPELCLGPVAESWPPQCHGVPLVGWDWSGRGGQYDESGDVRWGRFVVRGTFDGTTLTVTGAVGEAGYDPDVLEKPGPPDERARPGHVGAWRPGEQAELQRKLEADPLPGTLSVYPAPAAVVVEVVHDDGSLQQRVDRAYGAGRVEVHSMLVPVSRP